MHRRRSVRILAFALLTTGGAFAAPATAQTGSDASKILDVLDKCPEIATEQARLLCFETAAAEIAAARKSGKLIVLDRDVVVARKRQQFGLADATQNPLGGGKADRSTIVTEVRTTITNAKPAGYARFTLQLANNTVWETIEPLKLEPRPGASIVIKQSGFGGLKATISGERPVLIKRQR